MSTSTYGLCLSSATPGSCLIICSNGRFEAKASMITLKPASFQSTATAVNVSIKTRRRAVSCQAASAASVDEDEKEASVSGSEEAKVGAKVRVKAPLKVYHVNRIPELDLNGMEGVIKQFVGVWKGKKISANLPYKVEFVTEVEGRGPVKFLAHLKEDELDFLD
ncbi:Ferredoxin-thioredoxin reductase, variable chain [Hibiscus syriacus]|uniref:Ferredoxin-thioredoxin reductase, variable chain n=1 Tax=Hibiscus syriacus TaxID=106335 RepID=A0A6A2YFZ6_HIBSY|nr:ferredoxin-thioredoxin reductase, variable chain-like isoform X1 [Hibiscus syriacus]XP_039035232.1 ferredoxin-thioredoxin reductase, variable chain-like isoform X2 [Hibiscus syriacus]KAE8672744.1 Ferredoxin-thioredoxin reductase, variable chain [Hibiscus syriacus]